VTGRLDSRSPEETVERIDRTAAAILGERNLSVARRGVDALRLEVQQANEVMRQAKQRQVELHALRSRLIEFPGPRADEMLRVLDALETHGGEVTPAFRAAVEQARSAEQREAERRHVARALRSSLRDLGYELGEDFETLLGERGVADARQRWRGYALRVRSGGNDRDVRFNVVREDEAAPWQRARDKEIETSWCSDFEQLLGLLERHGVKPEIIRRTPAGTLPIPAARPVADAVSEGEVTDEPREEQSANP